MLGKVEVGILREFGVGAVLLGTVLGVLGLGAGCARNNDDGHGGDGLGEGCNGISRCQPLQTG